MYDSVNYLEIPSDAQMVAIYANGPYAPDIGKVRERFPHPVVIIRIDIHGYSWGLASVLDVERGAATPEMAPEWIRKRQALNKHHQCTIYANRSTMPQIQAACRGLTYTRWIADWRPEPVEYPGCVATQYKNTPTYDVSAVYNDAWHPKGS